MSTESYLMISCDRPGCDHKVLGAVGIKARELSKEAKIKGWKLGKKADFCPGCDAKIQEAIKKASQGNL